MWFALAGVIGFAVWTGLVWRAGGEHATEALQKAEAAAQAKIDEAQKKATAAEATKIEDMATAAEVALEQGRSEAKVIHVKDVQYVKAAPVFSNTQCAIPADGVSAINGQVTALRTATAEVLGLSGPATASGRSDGDAVSGTKGSAVDLPGLPPAVQPVPASGSVPGTSVRDHPKPKPVGG